MLEGARPMNLEPEIRSILECLISDDFEPALKARPRFDRHRRPAPGWVLQHPPQTSPEYPRL